MTSVDAGLQGSPLPLRCVPSEQLVRALPAYCRVSRLGLHRSGGIVHDADFMETQVNKILKNKKWHSGKFHQVVDWENREACINNTASRYCFLNSLLMTTKQHPFLEVLALSYSHLFLLASCSPPKLRIKGNSLRLFQGSYSGYTFSPPLTSDTFLFLLAKFCWLFFLQYLCHLSYLFPRNVHFPASGLLR